MNSKLRLKLFIIYLLIIISSFLALKIPSIFIILTFLLGFIMSLTFYIFFVKKLISW